MACFCGSALRTRGTVFTFIFPREHKEVRGPEGNDPEVFPDVFRFQRFLRPASSGAYPGATGAARAASSIVLECNVYSGLPQRRTFGDARKCKDAVRPRL